MIMLKLIWSSINNSLMMCWGLQKLANFEVPDNYWSISKWVTTFFFYMYLHSNVQNVFPSNFHKLLFNKRCLICPGITYFDFVPICVFCFLLYYISLSDTLIFVIVPNLYKTRCYTYVLRNTSKFFLTV